MHKTVQGYTQTITVVNVFETLWTIGGREGGGKKNVGEKIQTQVAGKVNLSKENAPGEKGKTGAWERRRRLSYEFLVSPLFDRRYLYITARYLEKTSERLGIAFWFPEKTLRERIADQIC